MSAGVQLPNAGVRNPGTGDTTPGAGVRNPDFRDTMPEVGHRNPKVGVLFPGFGQRHGKGRVRNPGLGHGLAEGGLYLGNVGGREAVEAVHQPVKAALGLGELALKLLLLGGHRGGGQLLVQFQ